MSLLKVNGVEVQATASEWAPVRLGEVVRSLNGAPRSTARVTKRDFRYTSRLLTVPEAELLRALIDGEGHVLSFDDTTTATSYLYTSREAAPVATSGVSRVSTSPFHGTGVLRLAAGGSVSWSLPSLDNVTILYLLRSASHLSAWTHWAWNAVSGRWFNGVNVVGIVTPPPLVIDSASSTMGFTNATSGALDVDDVVILPFAAPTAWMQAFYAFHLTRAWPALPFVWAEEPRMPAGGMLCLGSAGDARAALLRTSVGEVFDFALHGT